MFLRFFVSLASVGIVLLGSRVAHAEDGWYFGPRLSANTWRMNGTKLGADTYRIDGGQLGTAVGGALEVAGGFRIKWFYADLAMVIGYGGGVARLSVPASDLTLAPDGTLNVFGGRLELGALYRATPTVTLRAGGATGVQIMSIGMERPGYPDTHAFDASGGQATLGPTAGVIWSPSWFSIGAVCGADLLHPGSASIGVIMSHGW